MIGQDICQGTVPCNSSSPDKELFAEEAAKKKEGVGKVREKKGREEEERGKKRGWEVVKKRIVKRKPKNQEREKIERPG